jgi:LmbE family N-acetylglucosaminyl deacetylase
MNPFDFSNFQKVLCLGCHSDDIEIGAGGTMLRLIEINPRLEVYWVVFSGSPERQEEARRSAEKFLEPLEHKTILTLDFAENIFPQQVPALKAKLNEIRAAFQPDLIFTQRRDDSHQDHFTLGELTWNAFRSHTILEYEIAKYDGDLGQPNVFVSLTPELAKRKTQLLLEYFGTQGVKHWFDEETFLGLMRLRGLESATRYAEGFYARKVMI